MLLLLLLSDSIRRGCGLCLSSILVVCGVWVMLPIRLLVVGTLVGEGVLLHGYR